MTTRILNKITRNGIDYIPSKLFVIREDMVTVSTTATKWVAPYNTDYYYTNFTISEDAGIGRVEGAVYIFEVKSSMVVASAYRNVRVRIGNSGDYKPVMNWGNTILAGSSYFTLANVRLFQYSKKYQEYGALHCNVDTTYSAMSVDEGKTGTATSSRLMRADRLKEIIEYHAGNLDVNADWNASSGKAQILNKPTIPAEQVNSDWNATSGKAQILNKPTIPSVGNATITLIDENNTEIGNFTTNATTDKTITIPSGGGGGADVGTVNALVDAKLGNYDTLFLITDGLYKILNDLSDEDELGLTGGNSRDDITDSSTSMSLISHSYTVMVYVANSKVAMDEIVSKNGATKEVSECRNSISVIAESELARDIYLNSEYGNYYLTNYTVVQDAFSTVLVNLRGKQLVPFLTNSTFYNTIMSTPELKDSLSVCTLDDLTPAVCYYANLTGYDTWDDIVADSTALNTVLNNSTCMEILNCSSEFMDFMLDNIPLFVNNPAVMDIVVNDATIMNSVAQDSTSMAAIAGSAMALNKVVKSSTAIGVLTTSANNDALQAQKTTMYNTVTGNSTYFTQYTRTYQDGVSSLNSSCTQANSIVFTACGYWSSASSQKTNVFHANSVLAHSGSENYRPTSVAANTTNCVSFTNCTFTETGDGYAAIAVYRAV